MNIRLSRLAYGLSTYLPGVYRRFSIPHWSVDDVALDGYSKWLHHMRTIVENGFGGCPRESLPKSVQAPPDALHPGGRGED